MKSKFNILFESIIENLTENFNLDNNPVFSEKRIIGNNIVIYKVEDSFKGLVEIRKILDKSYGIDFNNWPWISRIDVEFFNEHFFYDKETDYLLNQSDFINRFSNDEILDALEAFIDEYGLYSFDTLSSAENYWKRLPEFKYICLKDNKITLFGTGENEHIDWIDLNGNHNYKI